jgi:hypothetical protein
MEPQQKPSCACRRRCKTTAVARGAIVACAVLAVGAMWKETQPLQQFSGTGCRDWGQDRFSHAGRVYSQIRPHLGQIDRVGFICTDSEGDIAELRYYMAQSMLAPTIVSKTWDADTLIAVFDTDAELTGFLSLGQFSMRQRVANGAAILDRVRK